MKILKIFVLVAMLIALGFTPAPVSADTPHCGDIVANQTWQGTGNVHVVSCDVNIASGVTLTISSGAIVKFSLGTKLIVNGTLRVLGSSSSKVYLSSIRDDSIGGDTNGDGGATTPNWDNWRGIHFQDGSSDAASLIDHAVIRYAGYGYSGNINLTNASPIIRNTTLSNGFLSIRANLGSVPILQNNLYNDSTYNGLGYDGGTIDTHTTWSTTDTALLILGIVYVGPGTTLTIMPGVIVKFDIAQGLTIDGTLRVPGENPQLTNFTFLPVLYSTSNSTTGVLRALPQSPQTVVPSVDPAIDAPVSFTSIRDDAAGGDSNGDGGATTPNWDNWRGIEFRDSSNDADSLINNAVIRYAGRDYRGNINLTSASPTIRNTVLSNGHLAIRANLRSLPVLENNTYENNTYNALSYDGGTISADTTWSSTDTSIVLLGTVYVGTDKTLTIQPGVVIKFDVAQGLYVDGSLRVLGTAGLPVTFTSIRDDSIGGDSNGDGGATTPFWDNWRGIEFRDSSSDTTSLIDHAMIRYGGRDYRGNITLTSASPTINNTSLSEGYISIRANLRSLPVLQNNLYEENFYNALAYDSGTITVDTVWSTTDTSIVILGTVYVGTGKLLTIQPGVVVKFDPGQILYVDGALHVSGIAGSPVTFTSIRDDAIGGDTNGNGGATTPNWDNWQGIEFRTASNDSASSIDHAVVRYAGWNFRAGITLLDSSVSISNTTVTNSWYGLYINTSTPTLTCNNFYNNNGYGLFNNTPTAPVNATNHWWGVSSGPYHTSLNPGGAGNAVSNGVIFDPWRNSACN